MPATDPCDDVTPGQGGTQENLIPVISGVPSPDAAWLTNHVLREPSSLCALGISPLGITNELMKLMTTHFSSAELIMQPSLKQYRWNPDTTLTKIRIVPATRFDPKTQGLFPAVVIKRGNLTSERVVMGDMADDIDENWAQQGRIPYSRFVEGQHQLFCIAEADGEAEDLGAEVFETLTYLSPSMLAAYGFHSFEVIGLSELGLLEEMGNRVGTSVTVKYRYELAWTLVPLAPPVKTLNIQTTTP